MSDRFQKRVKQAGGLETTVLASPMTEDELASLFKPSPRPNVEDVDFDSCEPMFPNARDDLICGECQSRMIIRKSSKYPKPFYGCTRFPECKGSHGAHADGSPLGIPANKATKRARIQAHTVFDKIWKENLVRNRGGAYNWMRQVMGLSNTQAHIGLFTIEQCETLVKLCYRDYPSLKDRLARLLYDADLFDDDGPEMFDDDPSDVE